MLLIFTKKRVLLGPKLLVLARVGPTFSLPFDEMYFLLPCLFLFQSVIVFCIYRANLFTKGSLSKPSEVWAKKLYLEPAFVELSSFLFCSPTTKVFISRTLHIYFHNSSWFSREDEQAYCESAHRYAIFFCSWDAKI